VTAAPGSVEVRAPRDQAEGTRSQILRWLKAEGDAVLEHEPLIEVETDKVTVEIPSPASGVLRQILKQEQDEIGPGEILARIEVAAGGAVTATPAVSAGAPRREAASTPSAGGTPRRRARADQATSPAVKRLLDERGLSEHSVVGTGPGGRITVDDVLRTPERAPDSSGPPSHHVTHSATRRRIAERMVQSLLHTAPHVTTIFEADFSAILAHRARYRSELAAHGATLTLTGYILAACVDAIRAVPEVNARWHEDSLEIFDSIDIGVGTAVQDKGLIVPVIRAVQSRNLQDIASELGRLVDAARDDRLTPADVRGGTFTISNHGVSGSLVAAPIVINQPQVASSRSALP